MFTGLIADLGEVVGCKRDGDGALLSIATSLAGELALGDSIAVNGVCLTATEVGQPTATDAGQGVFSAQAVKETLRRSCLSGLQVGSRVNLELPLRLSDRLGGHIVQGHVDGVAAVAAIEQEGCSRVLSVELPADLARYVTLKGSIALDGVSLTVSGLEGCLLSVSLIPETLSRTTLGRLAVGDAVNVEVDVLGKHVERLLGTTLTGR